MGWVQITAGIVVIAGALAGLELWRRRSALRRYPADGQQVRVDGVAMNVVVRGEGRPIVMLHGNYGDATDFSGKLRKRASADFKTVIIDRPGYGFSERPPEGLSLIGQAALVRGVVKHTGIARPLLVAHSWSGFLALAYALEHGSEIAGLVLLNPLCYVDDAARRTDPRGHAIQRASDAVSPVLRPLVGSRADRTNIRARFAPEPVPDTEATDPLLNARRERPKHRRARAEDFAAAMRDAGPLAAHYPEITTPIVIVVGEEDRIASPQHHAYRLHNQVHHSRLVVIPDAGHMIPITRPDDVMAAIHQAWQLAHAQDSDTLRPTPPKVDEGFIQAD
jgi:pimeloyl-ACP methyl ester carboxylesterase